MADSHFSVHQNFFKEAGKLRSYYDSIFAKPLEATNERFCWDYWNVPGSYTHLRTPAWEFFPEDIYSEWHNALLKFGREQLGCHEITPPWLSCYIDGCEQNLHADLPHGPWAFVYSITDNEFSFTGGSTKIMKPEILDYWDNMNRSQGLQPTDIFDSIPPQHNQLLVFDPRHPHGVEQVRGTQDVCRGRIVLHGWFTEPRPWIDGGLEEDENIAEPLNDFIEKVLDNIDTEYVLDGLLTLKVAIQTNGRIESIMTLSNTLIGIEKDFQTKNLQDFVFPKADKQSILTLPLVFSQDLE